MTWNDNLFGKTVLSNSLIRELTSEVGDGASVKPSLHSDILVEESGFWQGK